MLLVLKFLADTTHDWGLASFFGSSCFITVLFSAKKEKQGGAKKLATTVYAKKFYHFPLARKLCVPLLPPAEQ
jgi:hypothetical protein